MSSTNLTLSDLDMEPINIVQLAPWGSPPTPLLPRWYRETLSELQLPDEVRKANSAVATVGQLDTFWEKAQPSVDCASLRSSLMRLVGSSRPPRDYVVIPAGIDHLELARYPLRVRTANVLRIEGLLEGHSSLSVGELLSLKNFGILSLLDLMCVAELALTGQVPQFVTPRAGRIDSEEPEWGTSAWSGAVGLFQVLLAAASEFHGASSVGDALRLDLPRLAATIGIAPALESLSIRDLTNRRIARTVTKRLASLLASMSSSQKLILERRLFVSSPHTLQELAEQIGVTRERVRQIELRVLGTVEETVGSEISIIAALLREQLGPVIAAAEFERSIADVFNYDSLTESTINLASRTLKSRLSYKCVDGVCLDEAATDIVATLRDAAGEVADDVGLIDEEALRDHLSSTEWKDFVSQLIELCEFHRIGGRLALRDTAKARVKAALLNIGRASTSEEIAAMSELDPDLVRSRLSAIPTVVRADKTRWGLADWIDDVYEGIPSEIIQRINKDGGATPLGGLIEELPRLFGVSKSSVQAYVDTPQFTLHDGYVSLADDSSITLRDLDDVIDGRDALGNPYWTFLVENRYFDGYSLLGLPPELARELGCEPNGKTQALVTHPKGSGELSVIWRLASTTGANLGYLADPLQRLGVSVGDSVCMVIKGPGVVDLRRESTTASVEESSDTSADSLIQRMKNRRRVIQRAR